MPIIWKCRSCGVELDFTKFGAIIAPAWDWIHGDVACPDCVEVTEPELMRPDPEEITESDGEVVMVSGDDEKGDEDEEP